MGVFTEHPHTAVTEKVNALCSGDLDIDIELPELLSVTKLQRTGPTELARAIRKKLKYGSVREQDNAIDLLNAVVSNGGRPLEELYNDSRLLERVQLMANDKRCDMAVRKKIIAYAISWNEEFGGKGREFNGVVQLKHQLPKVKRRPRRSEFMDDEAARDDEEDMERGYVNPNDKYRIPKIDLKKEAPKIKNLIAESTKCSTDLLNVLQTVDTAHGERSEDNRRATVLFDKTRAVRRKILRYLQLVESEEFLGSLIHANEELVKALQKYTELNISQDSEDDESEVSDTESVTESLASMMIEQHKRKAPPPIPTIKRTVTDDPFGDANEVEDSDSD